MFKDLLVIEKSMVVCHKPKILKDLVSRSAMQASKDPNLQDSSYVAKQKVKAVELSIKDIANDGVVDNIVVERRLND